MNGSGLHNAHIHKVEFGPVAADGNNVVAFFDSRSNQSMAYLIRLFGVFLKSGFYPGIHFPGAKCNFICMVSCAKIQQIEKSKNYRVGVHFFCKILVEKCWMCKVRCGICKVGCAKSDVRCRRLYVDCFLLVSLLLVSPLFFSLAFSMSPFSISPLSISPNSKPAQN